MIQTYICKDTVILKINSMKRFKMTEGLVVSLVMVFVITVLVVLRMFYYPI